MLKKLALAAFTLTALTAHAGNKQAPAPAAFARPCFYELLGSATPGTPTIINLNQVVRLSIDEVYPVATKPKDTYVLTVWLPLADGASMPQVRASSPAPLIKLMREITAAADKCH
jgi:hypothetical protein